MWEQVYLPGPAIDQCTTDNRFLRKSSVGIFFQRYLFFGELRGEFQFTGKRKKPRESFPSIRPLRRNIFRVILIIIHQTPIYTPGTMRRPCPLWRNVHQDRDRKSYFWIGDAVLKRLLHALRSGIIVGPSIWTPSSHAGWLIRSNNSSSVSSDLVHSWRTGSTFYSRQCSPMSWLSVIQYTVQSDGCFAQLSSRMLQAKYLFIYRLNL